MPEEKKKIMTTDAGRPVGDNQNSLTVGPRGPVVFEDFLLFEKMAHFTGRDPGTRGACQGLGAHGHFVCTNAEITKYTTAKLFKRGGQKDPDLHPVFDRRRRKGFGRHGARPTRVCAEVLHGRRQLGHDRQQHAGVFIRDPLKFGDFIHTQKRDPQTNLKSPTMMWDFWSLLAGVAAFRSRFSSPTAGNPDGYRHMNGYSSHSSALGEDAPRAYGRLQDSQAGSSSWNTLLGCRPRVIRR